MGATAHQRHIGGPGAVSLYGCSNAERSGDALVGVDSVPSSDHDLAGGRGNGSGNRMGLLRSGAAGVAIVTVGSGLLIVKVVVLLNVSVPAVLSNPIVTMTCSPGLRNAKLWGL